MFIEQSIMGSTPLTEAARGGHTKTVDVLLAGGAYVDLQV